MKPERFQALAQYNRWANARLFEACAALPKDEYRKERKAFFGSIHGTLNHLLVADRIWMGRLEGVDSGLRQLDKILYDELDRLTAAREAEDMRLQSFVDRLDAARLEGTVTYHNTAGDAFETPVHWILAHMVNHQTHHRGQVHTMLSQADRDPPPLDLIYFLRQTGG